MAEDQDHSLNADPIRSALSRIPQDIRDILTRLFEQNETIIAAQSESVAARKELSYYIKEQLDGLAASVDKSRAVLFEKQDHLQGTMDLLRIDLRSNWNTADFAIMNSRSVREEQDKMLDMISTMQKQQQLLAAQVEELRKNALDKGQSGS